MAIICHLWVRGLCSHLLGPARRSLNRHGQRTSEPTESIAGPETNVYASCRNGTDLTRNSRGRTGRYIPGGSTRNGIDEPAK